jgi:hypothetical protein
MIAALSLCNPRRGFPNPSGINFVGNLRTKLQQKSIPEGFLNALLGLHKLLKKN